MTRGDGAAARSDDLVWYAAYGSNLSSARFACYLRGGVPDGTDHHYPGARDPSDPLEVAVSAIDRELAFGGTSMTWGGGVAFVHADASETSTVARLFLVTVGQFADVVAQENWLAPGTVALGRIHDLGELNLGGELSYGLVLGLGARDGVPVATFTRPRGTPSAAPSPAYLRHVAQGLLECGMRMASVIAYLAARPGIAGSLSPSEIGSLLV